MNSNQYKKKLRSAHAKDKAEKKEEFMLTKKINKKPQKIEKKKCPHCKESYAEEELGRHQETCSRRRRHCTYCDQLFPANLLASHTPFCSLESPHYPSRLASRATIPNFVSFPPSPPPNRLFEFDESSLDNGLRASFWLDQLNEDFGRLHPPNLRINNRNQIYTNGNRVADNFFEFSHITDFSRIFGPNGILNQEINRFREEVTNLSLSQNLSTFPNTFNQNSIRTNIRISNDQNLNSDRSNRFFGNLSLIIDSPLFMALREIREPNIQRGLTRGEINAVPLIVYEQKDSENSKPDTSNKSCVICLDDFKDGVVIRKLDCSHQFHANCIDEWLSLKGSCPICRCPLLQNN